MAERETIPGYPKLPQRSVMDLKKDHALYLWIHLSNHADWKKCVPAVAAIAKCVDLIIPPADRTEHNEIWAGVAFGPQLYAKLGTNAALHSFNYTGKHLSSQVSMPPAYGDIFIHAKCHMMGPLFQLTQSVMALFGPGDVAKYEDLYGWEYRDGRDLSGFKDTLSVLPVTLRRSISIEPETGGSYALTQKWVHNMDYVAREKVEEMEQIIGRRRESSQLMDDRRHSSHVTRVKVDPSHFIYRQGKPYGTLSDKSGLFFLAFAHRPANIDFQMDRMVGHDEDGKGAGDELFRFTSCEKTSYFYFPGEEELQQIIALQS